MGRRTLRTSPTPWSTPASAARLSVASSLCGHISFSVMYPLHAKEKKKKGIENNIRDAYDQVHHDLLANAPQSTLQALDVILLELATNSNPQCAQALRPT